MSEIMTIGLSSLKMGDVAVDGGMGTTLTTVGNVFEATARLTQEDGETTEFFAEQVDDAIESETKKGGTVLEFALVDFTPAALVRVLGGEVTGTGAAAKWNAPAVAPAITQSIELISRKNVKYEIVRAKIEGKLDVNFSKKEMGKIMIKAYVMAPTKALTSSISISKVVA